MVIVGFGNKTTKIAPYLTLSYGNGPGFDYQYTPNSTLQKYPWQNLVEDEHIRLSDPWYQHVGSFYLEDETHGGEDVAMYAKGPGSHLIRGVIEQNYPAHVISYSACIGPHAHLNEDCQPNFRMSSGAVRIFDFMLVWVTIILVTYRQCHT